LDEPRVFAPDGFTLATETEIQAAGLAHLVRLQYPMRVIRFGLSSVIPGNLGDAVNAADNLFAEKVFGGYRPSLFFDRLRSVFIT
jgi:hypothetical protein